MKRANATECVRSLSVLLRASGQNRPLFGGKRAYALFPAPSRSATSAINSPLADSPSSKWVDFRPQNHANNLVFIASSTFYLLAFFYS